LSRTQLPAAIRRLSVFRRTRLCRIFQNFEPVYFQALQKGLEHKIELLQFRNGDFCIQSVPPWVKWQSYLFFLENSFDRQMDDADDELDCTDQVAKLVAFLAEEFKVPVATDELAVYTASDTRIYARIRQVLKPREWSVVKKWIAEQRTFYVPELKYGYLGRWTVNHIATLAGEYVHALLAERRRLYFAGTRDFERQIWIQAMAYLGSKVINHKRKTNSIEDLRRSLLRADTKDGHRDVLLLALHQKVREITFIRQQHLLPLSGGRRDGGTFIDAARLLGAMLGERIYLNYQGQKISRAKLVDLISQPVDERNFPKKYYQILLSLSKLN
jgi:hypothetical protein